MAQVSSAAGIADASAGGSCDPPAVVAAEIPFQVFGNVCDLPALIPNSCTCGYILRYFIIFLFHY